MVIDNTGRRLSLTLSISGSFLLLELGSYFLHHFHLFCLLFSWSHGLQVSVAVSNFTQNRSFDIAFKWFLKTYSSLSKAELRNSYNSYTCFCFLFLLCFKRKINSKALYKMLWEIMKEGSSDLPSFLDHSVSQLSVCTNSRCLQMTVVLAAVGQTFQQHN